MKFLTVQLWRVQTCKAPNVGFSNNHNLNERSVMRIMIAIWLQMAPGLHFTNSVGLLNYFTVLMNLIYLMEKVGHVNSGEVG